MVVHHSEIHAEKSTRKEVVKNKPQNEENSFKKIYILKRKNVINTVLSITGTLAAWFTYKCAKKNPSASALLEYTSREHQAGMAFKLTDIFHCTRLTQKNHPEMKLKNKIWCIRIRRTQLGLRYWWKAYITVFRVINSDRVTYTSSPLMDIL